MKTATADTLPPLPESLRPPFSAELAEEENLPEGKEAGAFRTISEAAKFLGVPQHVLRFWESRFGQIKPLKLRGGRRYYRPEDMEILSTIKNLLYKQGYTIKGAKKAFGMSKAAPVAKEKPPVMTKGQARPLEITDRQHSQLAVIRQELIGLRETLKTYI